MILIFLSFLLLKSMKIKITKKDQYKNKIDMAKYI